MSMAIETSVVQKAVESIKHYLFTNNLQKGQKLPPEVELCRNLCISRNSLREALRILATEGYITLKPRCGAFVFRTEEIDQNESVGAWFLNNEVDVQDYLEVRSVCEPLATRLAIQRSTEIDIARLQEIHDAFLKAVRNNDYTHILMNEGKFHDTIIALSQNALLINLFKLMRPQILEFRRQSLRLPNAPIEAIIPHGRILRAFEMHDAEFGEMAMREHVKLAIYNVRCTTLENYSKCDEDERK